MPETTFTDEIDLEFGVPAEKYVDGELNPLCREPLTKEDLEGFSEEDLALILELRRALPGRREDNPVEYGWTIERWRAVMREWKEWTCHTIYGGNRSSKSTFVARICVYLARVIPEAQIRCWSVNEQSSINDQQAMVFDALPVEYKNIARSGKNSSMKYSQKNGFSGNKLVFPPLPGRTKGSAIYFQNYRSYALDPQVAEGWKAHGVWLDEEAPQTLFQTMRKRLWDYRGKMLLTFTTLQGWTALIHNVNSGAETIKRRFADHGKPPRMIPYEQVSKNEDSTKIWYFWTEDNIFIPTRDAVSQIKVRPDDEIMSRLYGVCTKAVGLKFPKFKRSIHVLKHEELPFVKDPGMLVTRYHTLDPAGRKKWFWLYFAVVRSLDDAMPDVYVYDEFPDISHGEWGLTSEDPRGKPGPGQDNMGHGVRQYINVMREMEGSAEIFERGIDKRYATSTRTGLEGNTRLLDELLACGMRFITPVTKRVDMRTETELGCQSINDYLDYDETRERDSTNQPHLFFSERCQNTITCLENYTGEGGPEEVWKDPVDCLRIFFDLEPRVIDWDAMPVGRRGKRGY